MGTGHVMLNEAMKEGNAVKGCDRPDMYKDTFIFLYDRYVTPTKYWQRV